MNPASVPTPQPGGVAGWKQQLARHGNYHGGSSYSDDEMHSGSDDSGSNLAELREELRAARRKLIAGERRERSLRRAVRTPHDSMLAGDGSGSPSRPPIGKGGLLDQVLIESGMLGTEEGRRDVAELLARATALAGGGGDPNRPPLPPPPARHRSSQRSRLPHRGGPPSGPFARRGDGSQGDAPALFQIPIDPVDLADANDHRASAGASSAPPGVTEALTEAPPTLPMLKQPLIPPTATARPAAQQQHDPLAYTASPAYVSAGGDGWVGRGSDLDQSLPQGRLEQGRLERNLSVFGFVGMQATEDDILVAADAIIVTMVSEEVPKIVRQSVRESVAPMLKSAKQKKDPSLDAGVYGQIFSSVLSQVGSATFCASHLLCSTSPRNSMLARISAHIPAPLLSSRSHLRPHPTSPPTSRRSC